MYVHFKFRIIPEYLSHFLMLKVIAHSVIIAGLLLDTVWGIKGCWGPSGLGCKAALKLR